MLRRALGALVLTAAGLGCSSASTTQRAVISRARYDLGCAGPIRAYRSVGGTYVGQGCGRWALYACQGPRLGSDVVCSKEQGPHGSRAPRSP